MIEVGRVAKLYRYPVKSMRGEAVNTVDVRWSGVDGDRQYAFHKRGDKSRFPWLTARTVAKMVLFEALYEDGSNPRTSRVTVATPEGRTFDITSDALAALLTAEAGEDVALLQLGRGTFDSMPISVIGDDTLTALGHAYGRDVEAIRFRPNIVIDRGNERDWMNGCLVFGDADAGVRLRLNKPIDRCSLVTVDPNTAAREPGLLRTVVENFQNEIGAYGVTEHLGRLDVGMKVWVEK